MAKKVKNEDALLSEMLDRLAEQGLPVQTGGFLVDAVSTGISSFDISTGIGGIPRRRLSLFVGEEGSGKTLLSLTTIASVQKTGGRAAFIDAEHALTPGFARLLGVDYDSLVISRPRTLEQCYDVYKEFVASGLFDVVVFDSAVALPPLAELTLSASDTTKRAGQAQVHSQELKKVVGLCDDRTAMVVINQLRTNPNPPSYWTGPPPKYSPGGAALNFYASLRVMFKTTQTFKAAGGLRVGHRIQTLINKSKVAAPFMKAEFDIKYTDGLDSVMDLLETALSMGVIVKKGAFFYYSIVDDSYEVIEELRWQGRAKMDEEVRERDDLFQSIRQRLLTDEVEDEPEDEESGTAWDEV